MDNFTVIKNSGGIEMFDSNKPLSHLKESCKGLDADPYEIIGNMKIRISNNMKTDDIQQSLIYTCADMITPETPDYQFAAARLELQKLYKRLYGSYEPKFNYNNLKDRIDLGLYNKDVLKYYNKKEINELCEVIDFKRDLKFTYLGINQLMVKYSVKKDVYLLKVLKKYYF